MHLLEVNIVELHERIRKIRTDLELTQQQYADKLGISRDTVNNLERGRMQIKEMYLRLICKTFRVNYFWLTEEKGDPYISVPDILMDDVIEKYGLDDLDKELIEEYVKLKPETRTAIKTYLLNIFNKKTPE